MHVRHVINPEVKDNEIAKSLSLLFTELHIVAIRNEIKRLQEHNTRNKITLRWSHVRTLYMLLFLDYGTDLALKKNPGIPRLC